jgi:hypothetical protein
MKVAFILRDEVQFARLLAYAAEHELYADSCIGPKSAREECGYFISWVNRRCFCRPIKELKEEGYYITDDVHIYIGDRGEYELKVAIEYEYIRF